MEIILIAAVARNYAIGKNNDLLWHLPDDFKHFKNLTNGHFIVMGRKTFESFPKPLPNRTHVIITTQVHYEVPDGCFVVKSIKEAFALCEGHKQEKVYVIGGGEIYKQTLHDATCLEITWVNAAPEAEVFFPEINETKWKETYHVHHPADEKHVYSFDFTTYTRR